MAFTISFFYIALLSLLITLVNCRESFNYEYDRRLDGFLKVRDSAIPDYDPSEDPPPCFTLCGVVAIDSYAKRSLCSGGAPECSMLEDRSLGMILEGDSDNSTDQNDLAKRTLTAVTGTNVDQFMVDTANGVAPAGVEVIPFVWDNTDPDRHNDGLNTVKWQPFGTTAFNMVTRQIHGCTVICVWSRKGVWCGHFWEPGYPTPNFNTQLRNSITGTGINKVDGPTLASLADQFTIDDNDPPNQQNTLFAAIMSPRSRNSANPLNPSFQYRTRIPAIKAAINEVIPALPIANIAAYAYVAVDAAPHLEDAEETELDTTARGRVAFQYDPSANGGNIKGTRLIFERGEVLGTNLIEDQWTVNPS
ncbi:hypothetical protein LTR35_002632 [Friedmanniomyces endolithicus]|uniref:Uncharacterized protein n=1 Tax=Friedmanniomyces endolithicus TaxID=329885 RepID=A0AAN6JGJ9_9PEZI|nr:hypothetical protein LTR35_002632 [Friedmanniomyces endolithicus]KAK0323583.1 hypothetical protein LTR82_005330 [Friedmanniomyces endolithicus]KAK1019514.1 hypothetical protein LTR54_000156 [Friedmanniomyces endolithicus]